MSTLIKCVSAAGAVHVRRITSAPGAHAPDCINFFGRMAPIIVKFVMAMGYLASVYMSHDVVVTIRTDYEMFFMIIIYS